MQHLIDSVILAQKLERCHNAVKGMLEPGDWQDNFNQWKALIDMHQQRNPGAQVLESVLFIANSIEGHYYSQMTLFAVAFEILSKEEEQTVN